MSALPRFAFRVSRFVVQIRIKENARVSVVVVVERESGTFYERESEAKKRANNTFESSDESARARTFQNSLLVCLVSHFQPVPSNVISIFVPGLVSRIRQGGVFGERGFFRD